MRQNGPTLNYSESPSLKAVITVGNSPTNLCLKERLMPWYAWLIMVVAIGSIVGGLMMLRDSANNVELTDEQRKRVAERNAQADAKDAQDR